MTGCPYSSPLPIHASREANFDIRFGFGIDELGALFEAAELCGVVERKGSYYYFGSDKLSQVWLGVWEGDSGGGRGVQRLPLPWVEGGGGWGEDSPGSPTAFEMGSAVWLA